VIERVLASGRKSFTNRKKARRRSSISAPAGPKKVEEPKGVIVLKSLKDAGREVERNSGREA